MEKKKVAITTGVFDCFHEGHANLLRAMKERADHIVIFIHDDLSTYTNKRRFPIQNVEHRSRNIRSIAGSMALIMPVFSANPGTEIATYILGHFQTAERIKHELVYMRGDDWPNFPGRPELEKIGVPIELIKYTEGVSTTQIRAEKGI